MRFCYADPPYIGQAEKHYSHDPRCAEVDHYRLIKRLFADFPDGWALSCSSVSLEQIHQYTYELCPGKTRIGSWVKPFCSFKPNVNPAYTWEPVLFCGGRRKGRDVLTKDHVIESITLRKGLSGVKPQRFCLWVFEFLGMEPGDELVDLFPGSGAVTEAWALYCARLQSQPAQLMLAAG